MIKNNIKNIKRLMKHNKKYRIKNKELYPNYIKFELNGCIGFGNTKLDFIFCPNEFPFKNYRVGDEVEISLTTNDKIVPRDMDVDDDLQLGEREDNNEGLELLSTQKQLSAYDKQTVHELFRISLEWLEKYIEVVYSDYQFKKQIHDNNITRPDA